MRNTCSSLEYIAENSFENHTEGEGIHTPGLKVLSTEVEKLIDRTGNGSTPATQAADAFSRY